MNSKYVGVNSNMKKIIFSLLCCFGFLALNAQESFKVSRLEIECSIIAEDVALDYYEISWSVPLIDSIAKSNNELPNMELHCFVYDSSGLIGYYKGLSTPMQHCSFQTNDSLVEVFFRWRRMPYSYYSEDSTEIRISRLNVNPFNKTPHRGYEFESVHLPVNSTINRKLTLVNDTNTVLISGRNDTDGRIGNYDAYGMPILGDVFNFYCIISLDKYYLNRKTGRIATGQKWLDRKGPKRISQNADHFLLVSPSVKYLDDDNNQYLGSVLIDKGRVKLKRFNVEDFISSDMENMPY
jgi:hypothetical protein